MSKKGIEAVIGKTLLDEKFRRLLLADPDGALGGFNLNLTEKSSLKRMDSETLEFLAKILNARLKRDEREAFCADQLVPPQPASF
jgi:hypothetical protein